MSSPWILLGVVAVLAAAGCGSGDEKQKASPTPTPSATAAPPANPTGSGPLPGAGLPDEPAVNLTFDGADGRISRGRSEDGEVKPGDKAVFMTAVIRKVSKLDARAGVYCRGSADGQVGYDLTVDRKGAARLDRLQNGRRESLQRFTARLDGITSEDSSEKDIVPVMLSCSTDPDGKRVQIGFVVGVKEITYFQDETPFDPPETTTAGRVAEGTADFSSFQLYVAE